jgi:hypothetical protein
MKTKFLTIFSVISTLATSAAWAGQVCAEADLCYVTEANNGGGQAIDGNTLEWDIQVSTDLHGDVKAFSYTGRDDGVMNGWDIIGSPDYKQMQKNRAAAVKKALAFANSLKANGVCAAVVDNSDAN